MNNTDAVADTAPPEERPVSELVAAVREACSEVYGEHWRETLCHAACWSPRFLERIMSGKNSAPPYFGATAVKVLRHSAKLFQELSEGAPKDRVDLLFGAWEAALEGATMIEVAMSGEAISV